jgi:hypothetical protein
MCSTGTNQSPGTRLPCPGALSASASCLLPLVAMLGSGRSSYDCLVSYVHCQNHFVLVSDPLCRCVSLSSALFFCHLWIYGAWQFLPFITSNCTRGWLGVSEWNPTDMFDLLKSQYTHRHIYKTNIHVNSHA